MKFKDDNAKAVRTIDTKIMQKKKRAECLVAKAEKFKYEIWDLEDEIRELEHMRKRLKGDMIVVTVNGGGRLYYPCEIDKKDIAEVVAGDNNQAIIRLTNEDGIDWVALETYDEVMEQMNMSD